MTLFFQGILLHIASNPCASINHRYTHRGSVTDAGRPEKIRSDVGSIGSLTRSPGASPDHPTAHSVHDTARRPPASTLSRAFFNYKTGGANAPPVKR